MVSICYRLGGGAAGTGDKAGRGVSVTYGIPDHAGGDLHHAAVDGVASDGEPPAFPVRNEAKMPLSARSDEVSAHPQENSGV